MNGAHVGEDSLRSLINSGRLGIGSAAAVGLCIAILHSSQERGSGWGGRRSSVSRLHLLSLSSIQGQATSPFLAGVRASPAAAWHRVQEDLGGAQGTAAPQPAQGSGGSEEGTWRAGNGAGVALGLICGSIAGPAESSGVCNPRLSRTQ